MRFFEIINDLFSGDDALYEMANLYPSETNIKGLVIWVSVKATARHDVRVKIARGAKANPRGFISIALRPNIRYARPKDSNKLTTEEFENVRSWITLNYQTIIDFWDNRITTAQMIATIVPLP